MSDIAATTPANRAAEPLQRAFDNFRRLVAENAPRPLRALNTPAALEGRICEVSAQIIACQEWLKALVEDTAQHLPMDQRLDSTVDWYMTDMASDVRGPMLRALEEMRS